MEHRRKTLCLLAHFLCKYNLVKPFFSQATFFTGCPLDGEVFYNNLRWRRIREGWNFWANVSIKWKKWLIKRMLITPPLYFWEELNNDDFWFLTDDMICNFDHELPNA